MSFRRRCFGAGVSPGLADVGRVLRQTLVVDPFRWRTLMRRRRMTAGAVEAFGIAVAGFLTWVLMGEVPLRQVLEWPGTRGART